MSQIVNEKDMLFKLCHPGIVKLYFTFQDSSWLYLALELCANGELAELIARKGRLPLDLSAFYAGELVNVLTYLRKQGVAHRDIKPENLFITANGHLKLGDFDTAKFVMGGSSTSTTTQNRVTERMNTFVGTAQYVSPEMLHDSAVAGFGSDLWALGCVVFQMLTGVPPFRSSSEYITFQRILATEYSFPEHTPEVGRSFVKSLLMLDPQDRLGFASMGDLRMHAFFGALQLETLHETDPPLTGVLRLKKRRIRTGSASDDEGGIVSSDDEDGGECSQLILEEDLYTLFNNAAPQSPTLQRASTTAPVSADVSSAEESHTPQSSTSIVTQVTTVGTVAPGGLKKAESSPALVGGLSRSMISLPTFRHSPPIPEESSRDSPPRARSSSLAPPDSTVVVPTTPPTFIGDSSLTRHTLSEDSVSSPLDRPVHDASESTDNGGLSSPRTQATSAAAALHVYLQRICASDEHVLMSGSVLKRRFFCRNRILVVTDLPRLLVLEPKTFRTLCEIPLLSAPMTSAHSAPNPGNLPPELDQPFSPISLQPGSPSQAIGLLVTYLSANDFLIETETSTWRGEVRDGTAQAWVSLIQTLKQKAVKTASLRPQRLLMRSQISPAEFMAREALSRSDFGSVDALGSVYSRGGFTSDLPSHAEIEAEAEARVEAALKLMGDSPESKTAAEIVAALSKQRSTRCLSPKSPSVPESSHSCDDQYRIDIDDAFSSSERRRRKNSSSCALM